MKPCYLLALTALALAGCQSGGTVASVNGEPVSASELRDYLLTKPKVQVLVNGARAELPVADTLAFQAVRDLVTQRVLVQMAREEKLVPSDKELDDEIVFRTALDTEFVASLRNRGLSMDAIRRLLLVDLCQLRLQSAGVTVTAEQVDKFVKDNPQQFVTPEVVDLAWVLAKSEERRAQAQAALDKGMDFKSVAREFSEAEGAKLSSGGYSVRALKEMPPLVREAVQPLKPGDSTGWISSDAGYAKFQCVSRVGSKPIEVTAARKEQVRRQMSVAEGSKRRDLGKQLTERLRQSKTKVDDPTLAPMWQNYSTMLDNSVATPSLPSSPGR